MSNVAEAMMEIPGLTGLDFTIPQVQNWEKVRDAVSGKAPLCLRHFYWDHIDDGVTDFAAYSKKLIDFFGRKGVFIQTSTPTHEEAVALSGELHKILSK